MEWLAVAKLVFGPVLGIFGAWLTHKQEAEAEERRAREKAADRAHELAVMDREAEIATARLRIESDIAQEVQASKAFEASYGFANDKLVPEGTKLRGWHLSWLVFVEGLNKAIRPIGVIWYQIILAVLFGWSGYVFVTTVSAEIADAYMAQIFRDVCYSIIGMAETSFFWFYGIRRMSKGVSK